MAGVRINIDQKQLTNINKKLNSLKNVGDGLKDILTQIGAEIESSTTQRFYDSKDPEGNQWTPSQRAIKKGDKTLWDHGNLQDDITSHVFGNKVEIGTNIVYAAIHQLGGETGRNLSVTLPKRPFLGISQQDERNIEQIIINNLQQKL